MQGDDYFWGAGPDPIPFVASIGPHHMPGDSIRYHVTWLYSSDPRILEMPSVYLDSRIAKGLTNPARNRRQSEHDDHGEAYASPTYDGPHVYYDLKIPKGLFILSIYDVNKEEHNLKCPYRDFRVSVHPGPTQERREHENLREQPTLASARINHFWEGKYTKFLVQGPTKITVEVNRNYSFDTIVSGIFLDAVDEEPPPYFETAAQWQIDSERRGRNLQSRILQYKLDPTSYRAKFAPNDNASIADAALMALEETRTFNPKKWAAESAEDYPLLLRWYCRNARANEGSSNDNETPTRRGTCYYWSGFYSQWEECQMARRLTPARKIEKAVRWNHSLLPNSGRGYLVIEDYMFYHPETRARARLESLSNMAHSR